MHAATVVVEGLAMLALPLAAAAVARSRWPAVGVGPLGIGAAAFVGSQVVHLPLNLVAAWLFRSGTLPAAPPAVQAWAVPLALGLSAGVCEETARVASLWRRRRPEEAVVTGLGHGGVEACLLGVLVLVTIVRMVGLRDAPGLPPEVRSAVDAFWGTPDAVALAAVAERACALGAHVGMSLFCGLALVRRSVWPWLAAVALHTGLDAGAVGLAPRGVWVTEGYVAAVALGALALAGAATRAAWPPAAPAALPPVEAPPRLGRRPLDARDADHADVGA